MAENHEYKHEQEHKHEYKRKREPDLEKLTKQKIVETCQNLHHRNMLAAGDGNVSYRLDDQRILITPSGKPKAFIRSEEMTLMTIDGEILSGKPSGERQMHLAVYRKCPQARAVVHAHPPTCIAWSIAKPNLSELPCEALSEVILATGGIPVVPYARPTTSDMGETLSPYLPQFRVMILARHGGLSWGESLEEAYMGNGAHGTLRPYTLFGTNFRGTQLSSPRRSESFKKNAGEQMGEQTL